MKGEMEYMPLRVKSEPEWHSVKINSGLTRTECILIVIALVLMATFIYPFVPTVGHAQEVTPKHDYPLTNKGSCMRLHDEAMAVRGASMQEVIEMCAANGVDL